MTTAEAPAVPPHAEAAVRWARASVERAVGATAHPAPEAPGDAVFREPRGVFVTLERFPSARLRGCIGFPLPQLPLGEAIAEAAQAAALEDPRFPRVARAELDELVVEVSILSVPDAVHGPPTERHRSVVVGRDGLLVEAGRRSGLLLPQVAVGERWDAVRFLEGTCEKAGLPSDSWRLGSVRVLRFQAEVYREATPRGRVVRSPASGLGSDAPTSAGR